MSRPTPPPSLCSRSCLPSGAGLPRQVSWLVRRVLPGVLLAVALPLTLAAPQAQASPTQASPTQASPTQASPTQASPTQGTVEAESMGLTTGAGQVRPDPTASGGAALLVWSAGAATRAGSAPADAGWLVVRARGEACAGAPVARVSVDGIPAGSVAVSSPAWTDLVLAGSWAPGSHAVRIEFVNDHVTATCDRNLWLDRMAFVPAQAGVEAESLPVTAGSGQAGGDQAAAAGAGLLLWSQGAAATRLSAPGGGRLVVRARAEPCDGAPRLRVAVDGRTLLETAVAGPGWTDLALPDTWSGGSRAVTVAFTNDYSRTGCDRNVWLDRLEVRPAPAPAPVPAAAPAPAATGNPFAGAVGWVDPSSPARVEADRRRAFDPAGAAALDRVARGPRAEWFGDWVPTTSLAAEVDRRVSVQTAAGALPVLVAYAVPHRDCGSHSAGGLSGAAAYRAWVEQLARGIGGRRAVVVLEPDALAQLDCLSPAAGAERTAMIASAVAVLSASPGTAVYVDGGGADWHSAQVMAGRLAAAGVAGARGFSLNVSNFAPDATNLAYGADLSSRLGGKPFVVDTSRNGSGSGSTWCNPQGRSLGARFTTATGSPLADAFLWVKAPGESDGTCGGGPPAGVFWVDYAIGLGSRSS